jgi:hypothetical protein
MSATFREAVVLMWDRFITHPDPTLPASVVVSLTTYPNETCTGGEQTAGMIVVG